MSCQVHQQSPYYKDFDHPPLLTDSVIHPFYDQIVAILVIAGANKGADTSHRAQDDTGLWQQ